VTISVYDAIWSYVVSYTIDFAEKMSACQGDSGTLTLSQYVRIKLVVLV
jgi:hypothetical protein